MLKRWLTLLSLLAVVATGCDGCETAQAPVDAAVVPKAPVPAPKGLIAKLVVPNPGRTIASLRDAAGGRSLLVPRSVGGLAANLFALPLQAAEHFDDSLPIVGAAVAGAGGVHAAVALHVRQTARVIAASTKGTDAKFTSEKVGDVIFLVPTNKSIREPRVVATLAVVDSYLVAADSREGVNALGPYLTRTLALEKTSGSDVVFDLERDALVEALRVTSTWLKKQTAEVEWPAPIRGLIDLEGSLTTLADMSDELGGGHVTLSLDDVALVLAADLAAADGAVAAPPVIDPGALLELPDDVLIAASWSESPAQRDEAAAARMASIEAMLSEALGEGWTAADTGAVKAALAQLAKGRGDSTTMGLRCTGIGLTGLARGAVRDREALDEAFAALLKMRGHEAVVAKLEEAKIELSAKKARILEVPGEMWRVRLEPMPEKKGDIVEEIDLLALVRDADYLAAAGMETVDTIQKLHAPQDERSLRKKTPIVDGLERLRTAVGDKLWLALMFDPQAAHACAVGKPGGSFAAPIVFGVGPRGDRIGLRLEIAKPLLRVAAKELGAL